MSTSTPRRHAYVALPTPRGSTRVHRIEMTDVVTGRAVSIDLGAAVAAPSTLGRAVQWLRRLASVGRS